MELRRTDISNTYISTENVLQLLANHALSTNQTSDHHWHMEELLNTLNRFQYGMDVNPKFTAGVTGVEYTQNMSAFDLLQVTLLHGWLIDPETEQRVSSIVQNKTYNECLDLFFLEPTTSDTTDGNSTNPTTTTTTTATNEDALLVQDFINNSSTQLTQYGLEALHDFMTDGQLVILFRNNHFSTMTKHANQLYLLVTDLGYANYPHVIWETFHDISGDTQYTNSYFIQDDNAAPTTSARATDSSENADLQLALQLSTAATISTPTSPAPGNAIDQLPPDIMNGNDDENTDFTIAYQLQQQLNDEQRSETLARQLQSQEDQYHRLQQQRQRQPPSSTNQASEKPSVCVIS